MTEPPQPAPVAPPPAEAMAERRHVTVMFCDLVDSTGIAAKLDAEGWRDLVGAYIDAASAAVAEMGGHVAKKLGDGLLALFGYPIAHENDVERAVRAALSIQRALHELNRKNAGTPGADGSVPVLLIMTDETGFGAASAFGGPIRTPTTRPPLADPKRETKVRPLAWRWASPFFCCNIL
jgi:class 3 adenylate cyclase